MLTGYKSIYFSADGILNSIPLEFTMTDTGLGEIDNEGVWGLQRAFRIAGTKSLICTLSKIDDYWTAQFMDAFYAQATDGNSIHDSFQKAQRWLRQELPDNPEIWTSFILIE